MINVGVLLSVCYQHEVHTVRLVCTTVRLQTSVLVNRAEITHAKRYRTSATKYMTFLPLRVCREIAILIGSDFNYLCLSLPGVRW